MRKLVLTSLVAAIVFALWAPEGMTAEEEKSSPKPSPGPSVALRMPLMSEALGGVPVAMVDDEAITLKELSDALATSHEAIEEGKPRPKIDPVSLVDRLITVKLILREASTIGLDELPEVKTAAEEYSKGALKRLYREEMTKGAVMDKAEAEKLFQDAVKEYKIRSVLFEKEEDAKQLEADLQAGKTFDDLAERAMGEGKAQGDKQANFLKPKDLQPEIEAAVQKLAVGAVSPPIKLQYLGKDGFVILRLEEVRHLEDPAARAEAEKQALAHARLRELRAQEDKLIKQYVTYRRKTIDALDFEAKKPGLEALAKDKRVLVEVKGQKPITVAELTTALQETFYHGPAQAALEKRLNRKKTEVIDNLLEKRLIQIVAAKKGFTKSERYKTMLEQYEKQALFSAFVQKAVLPDVKVTQEDRRKYYEEKASEYRYPAMIRLRSLAFGTTAQAEQALEKLQKGADLNWIRANAEGRVKDDAPGVWKFDGQALIVDGLEPEVKAAVSGARPGDLRVCSVPNKLAYVLLVEDAIPARPQPFEEVEGKIQEKVFGAKFTEAMESWATKLKAASKIEVYVVEGAKAEAPASK